MIYFYQISEEGNKIAGNKDANISGLHVTVQLIALQVVLFIVAPRLSKSLIYS